MKREIIIMCAVVGALAGCQKNETSTTGRYGSSTNVNEPAGAMRETNWISTNMIRTNLSTNINEPAGAPLRDTNSSSSGASESGATGSYTNKATTP